MDHSEGKIGQADRQCQGRQLDPRQIDKKSEGVGAQIHQPIGVFENA